MSGVRTVDAYMTELSAALLVRGAARRRFLRECRDHLTDAAAERTEAEAVRSFGPALEIAAAFDGEVAARRGVRSTFATAAGVLATGGSTLALIHAASARATAPAGWAIGFWVFAQLAGVAAGLALMQALALRRTATPPAAVALLCRRNGCALAAAVATLFCAGAALPGRGSAAAILAGPALLGAAMVAVLRTTALVRRLDGSGPREDRRPGRDVPWPVMPLAFFDARRLLPGAACAAAAAAFVRDRGEHATVSEAFVTAGIEGAAVLGCFLVFGPALGLWRR